MKKIFILFALAFLFCGCAQEEKTSEVITTTTLMELGTTFLPATTSLETTTTTSVTTTTTTTTTTSTTTTTTRYSPVDLSGKDAPKITVSLNKGTYHSAEQMKIDLEIDSPREVGGVEVRVYGIFAGTRFWLNKTAKTSLFTGINNITFYYTLPLCNRCSGIAEGTYVLEAEIAYEDKAIARDIKSFSLIQ